MARRRKRKSQLVAARTLTDIKQKKLAFLREVSSILSDALGFNVKVSLSKPDRMAGLSPTQRKFARLPKRVVTAQMREVFAPFEPTHEPD